MTYARVIALCENLAGIKMQMTVLQFVLREINLLGINSVNPEMKLREKIWRSLPTDLSVCNQAFVQEVNLQKFPAILLP